MQGFGLACQPPQGLRQIRLFKADPRQDQVQLLAADSDGWGAGVQKAVGLLRQAVSHAHQGHGPTSRAAMPGGAPSATSSVPRPALHALTRHMLAARPR